MNKNGFLSNPDPGENLVSRNLVMETGCMTSRFMTVTDGTACNLAQDCSNQK